MAKEGLILILITSMFLTLSSCGIDYRYSLDKGSHNQIECVWEENNDYEPSHIIYKDKKYMFVKETDFISIDTSTANVLVSWNGNRYFGYLDEYYSYTTENPMFIYYKTWVFLSEDYNYLTDTFVVENTSAEIIWKDIFGSEQLARISFIDPIEVVLYSKRCHQIKTQVEIVCVDHRWYLYLPDSQTVWTPSEEFIKILSKNGII